MLFFASLPSLGYAQADIASIRFFENGQATRKGADVGMFSDTPTRLKVDLSGSWQYSVDGKDWNNVSVPSAYSSSGKMTFLRTFDITSDMLDKYTFSLVAYGINYQSEILINGNFIGRHTGGYSSFVLPIPQNALQVGSQNAVKVLVDNELTPKTTIPLRQQVGGWRSYGGIFRDIYILATPRLFIESPDVKSGLSASGKTASVTVQAVVTDRGSSEKSESGSLLGFQVEVYDKLTGELTGRSGITPLVVRPNKSLPVSAELTLPTPKVWSPETPDLYTAKCEIVRVANKQVTVLDEYDVDCGICDLDWEDGYLFVNRSQVNLKGVLWNEDHATYASAMTYETLERDVALIKTLGANLIRFQYPPHPYMLNLCDRYGLFAMEEIPLVDVPAEIFQKDYYQELASLYLKDMVARDRNHVSVLAWGIGNGFETSQPGGCEYVVAARNIVKSADARPVYFSSRSADDPCFNNVDLIAVSCYSGEAKDLREQWKEWKNRFPDKPIIVVRYGKDVEPGNRNGYSDPQSMESQARYAMQCYDALKEAKVAGGVLCAFNDWRGDRPALTSYAQDPYLQAMGLVTYDRDKRVAFDVVRALFNGEKVQAMPVGNYASGAPIVFVVVGLVLLISFAFLYNSNRRFRDCVNRSLFRTYNFFADIRDQRILKTSHSLFLALIVAITWATMLSIIAAHFRNSILFDNMVSQFMPDKLKESFVRLVWSPAKFILVVSAFIFLKLLFLTLVVKLISMTVRTYVYFYHAFSITIWSMLPYIIFIPIVMVMYRLLETEFYILPLLVVFIVISCWVLLRLLKGVSIIYDVAPGRVYAIGVLLIVVVGVALYGYYDYTQSSFVYLKYMMRTVKGTM